MDIFNLTFRTLGGQTYEIPVESTSTIHDVKIEVLKKLNDDENYHINKNLLEDAEIRLSYAITNNSYDELMDTQLVSDYPALSKNPLIVISINISVFEVNVVDQENKPIMKIYIKPKDTIFDVKKKMYMKLLSDPDYKPSGSNMITIYNSIGFPLNPSLTVAQYPSIQKTGNITINISDEQFYAEVRKVVSRNHVNALQDDIPFSFLMKGSELKDTIFKKMKDIKNLSASFNITKGKEFALHIEKANGEKIEDDAYLFEYPTMEYDSKLYLVYPGEKNYRSNYSYSNSNSNYGGRRSKRRMTKCTSRNKRKTRRSTYKSR
jgi:hypothetical protein